MKITKEKIQKITSRGQVTLPIAWRRKVKTDTIRLRTEGENIEIAPVQLGKTRCTDEYTVFDAIRDNRGKGLRASDLIKVLKKIDK